MDRLVDGSLESKEKSTQLFDETVNSYMEKYRISQGAACVMKGDSILVESGYGVKKDTRFRIGSITKFFTRVGIIKLVDQNKLTLDTPVFPLLGLKPLEGEQFNLDLNKITVQQLLDHQGGWDQQTAGEITFQRPVVAKAWGKPEQDVTPEDMVRYMLSKPLQFEPGARKAYSGFGYSVLGRVIEKVSGLTYEDFVKNQLTEPLGLHSIQLGHTAKDQTLPDEANYEKDSGTNSNEDPYKDLCLEMADSAGGLVSNAVDLCKFLNHYWGNGKHRNDLTGHHFYMNGRSVGTLALALQRDDGINAVVLFNNRHNRDNKKDEELRVTIDETLSKIF
jgi:CubicO group peptidase (beta-lactamase class C family)